jgi:hypothetical protein
MVTVRLEGPSRIVIEGVSGVRGVGDVIRRELDKIQAAIAEAFETEFAYGGALKKNTPEYERRKVAEGYDPRRGHRTGELQDALNDVKSWQLRRVGTGYHAIINDDKVIQTVWHAEYYIESKTRRRVVMAFTLADAAVIRKAVERQVELEDRRKAKEKARLTVAKKDVPPSRPKLALGRRPSPKPRVGTRVTLGSLRSMGDQFRRRAIGG